MHVVAMIVIHWLELKIRCTAIPLQVPKKWPNGLFLPSKFSADAVYISSRRSEGRSGWDMFTLSTFLSKILLHVFKFNYLELNQTRKPLQLAKLTVN